MRELGVFSVSALSVVFRNTKAMPPSGIIRMIAAVQAGRVRYCRSASLA